MATTYFAKINESNVVENIFLMDDTLYTGGEAGGLNRLNKLHGDISPSYYKQYFLDGTRKNPACIGGSYDAARDAFIDIKPYPSWVLNESTCIWEPPVAIPSDAAIVGVNKTVTAKWQDPAFSATYTAYWDEDNQRWIANQATPENSNFNNCNYTWNGTAWVLI